MVSVKGKQKIYSCPNIGCKEKFKYRSYKQRHILICTFSPPVIEEELQLVVKLDTEEGYQCTKCKTTIKQRNNIRHRKNCTHFKVVNKPKNMYAMHVIKYSRTYQNFYNIKKFMKVLSIVINVENHFFMVVCD